MRRTTRKALINLSLFITAIVVLLYLTSSPSDDGTRAFAWTKIRYVPKSQMKIAEKGKCPGIASADKPVLVVARTSKEDTQWLEGLKSKYHLCKYTADVQVPGSHELQTPANRGHESMSYLTFLIDNYNDLPETEFVFVHGTQYAWHNDHPEYDNAKLLRMLNTKAAVEDHGYHNLKCDWSSGTCPRKSPPQGSAETRARALLEPWNGRAISDAAMPAAFATIFGQAGQTRFDPQVKLGSNDVIKAQCCAQFVVSRDAIWQHTKEEFSALRQWLLETANSLKGAPETAAAPTDLTAGRVLSYIWHILFIRHSPNDEALVLSEFNSAACPTAQECYCKLYGRCDLNCPRKGSCVGQYRLPQDEKLVQQDAKDTQRQTF